jgi:hypothetical protein
VLPAVSAAFLTALAVRYAIIPPTIAQIRIRAPTTIRTIFKVLLFLTGATVVVVVTVTGVTGAELAILGVAGESLDVDMIGK